MNLTDLHIRPIAEKDNKAVAVIVRATLKEFNADHPGTAYYEEETDFLYTVFQTPGSVYYVAEKEDVVMGGAGIFPTSGLPASVCELVKMYILPEARGIGLGRKLMAVCFEAARAKGYKQVYLETKAELQTAVIIYEKYGFRYLPAPLGNTGHFGCELWMIRDI
ncbi:MAG: GNAT family N-acetyltransferase [Sphingobacteriales bacterium]|nr:GNAT family N-acetyltransferase [Sphingobacteriales bacterium]OJY86448.1 MAG: GNAT family N-acetyltransferase [Sphingobacteriales bacterium 44-15]